MSVLTNIVLGIVILLLGAMVWTRSLARSATRRVPQPGTLQPVVGGVMHYIDTGPRDATTLVLIHGLGAQLQHFTYGLVDKLKDEYRVIAVDRPGCGYSSLDDGDGASLADQARMIDEMLAKLGVERAVMVGHSMGGAVALRLALDFPERTSALALFGALTLTLEQTPDVLKGLEIKSSRMRRFLGATIAAPLGKLSTNKLLTEAFRPEPILADFQERAGLALALRPSAFIAACSDLFAVQSEMAAQVARYKDELKAPGGVIFGAEDAILPSEHHGQGMTEYGLSCEILPDRGHMTVVTMQEESVDFICRMAAKAKESRVKA